MTDTAIADPSWHAMPAADAARGLGVDVQEGLSSTEAAPRAAVVSRAVAREWETPVVIALVMLLNATVGFVQEAGAELGVRTVAGTMAFVTFVFFHASNVLNVGDERRSVFSSARVNNHAAFIATGAVVALIALVVEMDALHGFLSTTDLTSSQWLTCVAVGSAVLWIGELVKIVPCARTRRGAAR